MMMARKQNRTMKKKVLLTMAALMLAAIQIKSQTNIYEM